MQVGHRDGGLEPMSSCRRRVFAFRTLPVFDWIADPSLPSSVRHPTYSSLQVTDRRGCELWHPGLAIHSARYTASLNRPLPHAYRGVLRVSPAPQSHGSSVPRPVVGTRRSWAPCFSLGTTLAPPGCSCGASLVAVRPCARLVTYDERDVLETRQAGAVVDGIGPQYQRVCAVAQLGGIDANGSLELA